MEKFQREIVDPSGRQKGKWKRAELCFDLSQIDRRPTGRQRIGDLMKGDRISIAFSTIGYLTLLITCSLSLISACLASLSANTSRCSLARLACSWPTPLSSANP